MHSSIRTLAAISCAIVVAASAVGCGGDDKKSGGSSSAEKAAIAKYKSAAGKVCLASLEKIREIPGKVDQNSPASAQDAAFKKIGTAFLGEVESLKAITAPDSIADDVDAWLTSFAAAATEIRKKGSKLLAPGIPSPFADADAKAGALGVTKCLSGAS